MYRCCFLSTVFPLFLGLFSMCSISLHLFQPPFVFGRVIYVLEKEGLENLLLLEQFLKHFFVLFEVPLDRIYGQNDPLAMDMQLAIDTLPSGMSGKHEQMYCAIHTSLRSSWAPRPKEVIPELETFEVSAPVLPRRAILGN